MASRHIMSAVPRGNIIPGSDCSWPHLEKQCPAHPNQICFMVGKFQISLSIYSRRPQYRQFHAAIPKTPFGSVGLWQCFYPALSLNPTEKNLTVILLPRVEKVNRPRSQCNLLLFSSILQVFIMLPYLFPTYISAFSLEVLSFVPFYSCAQSSGCLAVDIV